ncbi:MAG TPA: T9SS type A sorting domain-containing protein, partial [Candidatus Cloacimonadota bacterium]|nr:T9SS type A sorting domain-containing protein [Candidatus Cloacimonadota bacterium]
SGARLWFPIPGDSVTVQLASEQNNFPGEILQTVKVPVDSQLIDVNFPSITAAQKIWLIVSYTTNFNNRFVAASQGGGSNSYYMNEVGNLQSLTSMATAGFNCELLFGLLGDFNLDQPDLQLLSFSLNGDLTPRNRVYPVFSIYNHSDQAVTGAGLSLVLNTPATAGLATYDIPLGQDIAPRSTLEIDTALPGWENYGFELPNNPTQLRIEADLYSSLAENDTLLVNNSKSVVYNVFSDVYPLGLIENFLRYSETGVINQIQDTATPAGMHRIQYYPNLSDSLANLGAAQRFNWYAFNSVPRTVGAGKLRITGYNDDYGTNYAALIQNMSTYKTFISESGCTITPVQDSENIQVNISLQNQNTALFTAVGQSLVFNSRLFVGLFKKHTISGAERYVLARWISFADTINTVLGAGTSHNKSYNFTASGISSNDLIQNYRIYYWLQGTGGGQVHYANFSGFSDVTFSSSQDHVVVAPELRVYPNPLRTGGQLAISTKATSGPLLLKVYNLRGQVIYEEPQFTGSQTLDADVFPASGLYFIRLQSKDGTTNKRISVIK